MNCKRCGTALREEAKFCPKCGASAEIHTGMCPSCNNPINAGMRFCRVCGKSLEGIFCPVCQRVNPANTKFCVHCGAVFSEQALDYPYSTGKLPPGVNLGGRYLIVRKIAQGGMGAVYEAKELVPPGRRLAIKEMSFSMLKLLEKDEQRILIDSFYREFELLSRLSHPNLVQAHQFFEEQGRHYYVMEFLEGRTLESLLDNLPQGDTFSVERVMGWARQLCDVLAYLHSQTPPVIYRDLKPSNVMELILAAESSAGGPSANGSPAQAGAGLIKLFDFGIARFYKPGQKSDTLRFGTDGYLAPEIIAYHSQTSEQTDIYSLGVLLHQLFTRHDPLSDPWRRPLVRKLNPGVPEHVEKAIERATALDAINRTPNARDMLQDLLGPSGAAQEDFRSAALPSEEPSAQQAFQSVSVPAITPSLDEADISIPILDLGVITRGKLASRSFDVVVPGGQSAQVSCSVPWLEVKPPNLTAGQTKIMVYARSGRLRLGRWGQSKKQNIVVKSGLGDEQSREPAWYKRLPGFLRGWLGIHLKWLVPLPQKHQGLVQVSIPGALASQLRVKVDVRPPAWRVVFGWFLTLMLMMCQVGLILGVLAYLVIEVLM